MWQELFADELARGIVASGLIAILAIPQRMLGQLLKILPDTILPPENIPLILGAAGMVGGYALGFYTAIPMDLAMAIGTGSGMGAKAIHDHSLYDKASKKLSESGVLKPRK